MAYPDIGPLPHFYNSLTTNANPRCGIMRVPPASGLVRSIHSTGSVSVTRNVKFKNETKRRIHLLMNAGPKDNRRAGSLVEVKVRSLVGTIVGFAHLTLRPRAFFVEPGETLENPANMSATVDPLFMYEKEIIERDIYHTEHIDISNQPRAFMLTEKWDKDHAELNEGKGQLYLPMEFKLNIVDIDWDTDEVLDTGGGTPMCHTSFHFELSGKPIEL